jgi:hypothetical protein
MKAFLLLVLWGCLSCASAPVLESSGISQHQQQLQELLWRGDRSAALDFLHQHRWSLDGSVALERARQDLRLAAGQRQAVFEELHEWQQANPGSADLMYLRARLLEDPVGRFQSLRSLQIQYPQHVWGRLGLIATAQLLGRWKDAQRWLQATRPTRDSGFFFRLVQARQWQHDHQPQRALDLLSEDAFDLHHERALVEYASLAAASRNNNEVRRARSELALRRAGRSELDTSARIDLAFQRLLGEWHRCKDQSLEEILMLLDQWCAEVGAPSGWAKVDRYRLAGVAQMVRPETDLGGVSLAWANAGRYLLAGTALGRDKELHLLCDVVVMRLDWPKHSAPIEMVAARSVLTPQAHTAQGGTVFRGFYLRLDSLERGAERLERSLAQSQEQLVEDSVNPTPIRIAELGSLESMQLPQRLRLAALASGESSVRDLELTHLALHEAGHLGEVLRWIDEGLPVASVAARFLNSSLHYGDALMWLEYRAQLRALASGWQPGWALAEIIERGQNPQAPYYAPYRQILRDLVRLANSKQWPHLALWDQLPAGSLVGLARELIQQQGFEPCPDLGTDRVVQSLLDFNLIEHAPGNRLLPVQLD